MHNQINQLMISDSAPRSRSPPLNHVYSQTQTKWWVEPIQLSKLIHFESKGHNSFSQANADTYLSTFMLACNDATDVFANDIMYGRVHVF